MNNQPSRLCGSLWGFRGLKRITFYVFLGVFVFPAMSCTTVESAPDDVSREYVEIVTEKEISRIINCASREEKTEWGTHVTELSAAILASPEEVWVLLTDYEKYPEFVPGATSYKVVARNGDEATVETRGTVKVKVIVTITKKLEATMKYRADKDGLYLEWIKQTANVNLNRGTWTLQPIERDGRTYTLLTHVVYSAPDAKEKLANMVERIESDETQMIRNIRTMLEK